MKLQRSRLSLWLAGIGSFIAAATLLSTAAAAAPRKIIGDTCRVSDPEPPLNVRTGPNGSVVGSLSNGTVITVLDHSKNDQWVYVGKADRSPIGWVYRELIDCTFGAFASANGVCRVSDPEPPLNVRTGPNGSVVGSLSNGTVITVLDHSKNNQWVYVGKADRSPIGWVYREYIDCKPNDDTRTQQTPTTPKKPKVSQFECYLNRQFPELSRSEKDPIIRTIVRIAYAADRDRETFSGMEITHELQSGAIRTRHEQYRDYATSFSFDEDYIGWKWNGTLRSNAALSMKGKLSGGEGEYRYSEQLTNKGKLDWAGVWSCTQREEQNW